MQEDGSWEEQGSVASSDRRPSVSGGLRALTSRIQDRTEPWDVRDDALNQITDLCAAGSLSPNLPDFTAQLKAVVRGLVAQLSDLRSQVVRSACAAISQLVAVVGDHPALDRLVYEQLLPGLL